MSIFNDIGTVTTADLGVSLPKGDGSGYPSAGAVTATGIMLSTAASTVSQFLRGFAIRLGDQYRIITDYSTARFATVKPWDQPLPGTAQFLVVGVPMDGHDTLAIKAESLATGQSASFRADVYSFDPGPIRSIGTAFSLSTITAASTVLGATAAGMVYHAETKIVDAISQGVSLGKLFVETAPTADMELFLCPMFTRSKA